MGKIYGVNGEKMGLQDICDEVVALVTEEQAQVLTNNIGKFDFKDSQMKLAHGILDTYKTIDGTSETGARLRKLLDNLMNKYQKSVIQIPADQQSIYHNLICDLKHKCTA